MWSSEYSFTKTEDEIKSHDASKKQHAYVKKLKGQKDTKEIFSQIKQKLKKDKDRETMACYGCSEPFNKDHKGVQSKK